MVSSPALVLLLQAAVVAANFINWDMHEHPIVDSFQWVRPFPDLEDDDLPPGGFEVPCKVTRTFKAKQFKLVDLAADPPAGLKPWATAIEDFITRRPYPGSWDGVDHGGKQRDYMVMDWLDLPIHLRNWIETQQREDTKQQWLYGVFEKNRKDGQPVTETVKPTPTATPTESSPGETASAEPVRVVPDKNKFVVFPAAAIYDVMPLWLAKWSKCECKSLHSQRSH